MDWNGVPLMIRPEYHQELSERIAKFLALGTAILFVIRLIVGSESELSNFAILAWLVWITALYVLIRREYLLEHAAHTLIYSVLILFLALIWISGGPESYFLYVLPLIPMVSGLMLPRVHTVVITLGVAAYVFWLYLLKQRDFDFIFFSTPIPVENLRLMWVSIVTIIAAMLALDFAIRNERLAITLRDEARIDFLTHIANRRGLEEELNRQRHSVSQRDGWLSVLMVDIDHFKRFNDQFGHTEGDQCLSRLASLLKSWAHHHNGFVGRFGGEEFMVILPDVEPQAAFQSGETIRHLIESSTGELVPRKGKNRNLTVTVGVSSLEGKELGDNFDHLIEAADQALYLGKAQGRNRVIAQQALPASLDKPQEAFEEPESIDGHIDSQKA